MFVTDFFFSFFLLAFMGTLMVGGVVLLGDALRRLVLESYKTTQRKQAVVVKISTKKAQEKSPFEHAA